MLRIASDVCAQLYVYERKSIYPAFLRCLIALCGDEGEWSLRGVSVEGVKRIPKAKTLTEMFAKFTAAFPDGVNHIEIIGKDCVKLNKKRTSDVTVGCQLSPLNVDWAEVGEIDPAGYTRPVLQTLWGFKSQENFVSYNKVRRDPVSLIVQIKFDDENISLSRRSTINLFKDVIQSWSDDYAKGYIGFIDARPLPILLASDAIGGEKLSRMDSTFDQPHMIIFGSSKVLHEYFNCVRSEYPKIDMIYEAIGNAAVVAFKNRKEISNIYMPKWHNSHP